MAGAEGFDYKNLFALSMLPAAIGLGMFIFIKQKRLERANTRRVQFWKGIGQINGQLRLYLLVVFLFTLGNSSNTFLLLKAKAVGFDDLDVILLYFIYNVVASILSMPLGRLSDRIGKKRLLVSGYLAFALCYAGFAFAGSRYPMIAVFVVYGIYTAMITGAERAFVAEISPVGLKGTLLGLHSTLTGIALLPASILAGILWDNFGNAAPFLFGVALSLAAATILASSSKIVNAFR
jgi:MFS family permease